MNHEYHIMAFWRASLHLFTCEQLEMFAKITLNAYRITLLTLLKHFGWIFVVWLGLIQWPTFMQRINGLFAHLPTETILQINSLTVNIASPLIIFFIVLAARSSITRKHWYYFSTKTIRFLIPFLCTVAVLNFPLHYAIKIFHIALWLQVIITLHSALFIILFCFFYIDMRSLLKALANAARMFIYTYPVMLIMGIVVIALHYLCVLPVTYFSVVLSTTALVHWISGMIFWLFGATMLVVMMSNIYMKHVYEYNKIYCPIP